MFFFIRYSNSKIIGNAFVLISFLPAHTLGKECKEDAKGVGKIVSELIVNITLLVSYLTFLKLKQDTD